MRAADRRSRSRLTLALRPRRAADEFRRLCQDLTTLPPRTLDRLALPAELRESIDEVRGSGQPRFLPSRWGGRSRARLTPPARSTFALAASEARAAPRRAAHASSR